MVEDSNIEKLLTSYLSGKIELWETKELLEWINASPTNKEKFDILKDYWEKSRYDFKLGENELDQAFENSIRPQKNVLDTDQSFFEINPQLKPRRIGINWRSFSVAASVAIVLGIIFWLALYIERPIEQGLTTRESAVFKRINPKGLKAQFRLPDGSRVWLNAQSELMYYTDEATNERIVNLIGEGYFDVKKDPSRPFYVYTSDFTVKALGTSFNVNSYEGQKKNSVALLTGKVEVRSTQQPDEEVHLLLPGMGLIYNNNSSKFENHTFNSKDEIAWKDGVLIFEKSGFDETMKKLEIWYGVTFKIKGTPPFDFAVSGKFDNENLDNVLKNLQFGKPFKYQIKDKEILIKFN